MNYDEFIKECRNKAFNSNQLDIIKEAVNYGIELDRIRILAKTQYDEFQMEQILRALKENIPMEIMELLTGDKHNHLVMAEIIDGAIEGLSLEDIKAYALTGASPQEMRKKRLMLIKQLKLEESVKLSELMETLKSEMEALRNSFNIMENQSEKTQEILLSMKEEELNEAKKLIEAKELVIKNLQTDNRKKQDKIELISDLLKKKEKELQDLLNEKNKKEDEALVKTDIPVFINASFEAEQNKSIWNDNNILNNKNIQNNNIQNDRNIQYDKNIKNDNSIYNDNNIQKINNTQYIKDPHLNQPQGITALENTIPIKQDVIKSRMNLIFQKKKPNLMNKILEKKLSAEQTKEIRLGIEDNLTEEQLIMMADAALEPKLLAEIRSTMKQLNERRMKGENNE